MKRMIKWTLPFFAIFFLIGCGSSDSTETGFTTEMVSGKTIYTKDSDENGTEVWYRVTFMEDGNLYVSGPHEDDISGDWSVVDGAIVGTDDGEDYRMTLVSSTNTTWTVNDGSETTVVYLQQNFTEKMIVGNTYEVKDDQGGTDLLTFNADGTLVITAGGFVQMTTYLIDPLDGTLILDNLGIPDIHCLIYEEKNGDLFQWNKTGDKPSTWVLHE